MVKNIDCVVVQQDLQEPPPTSSAEQTKAIAEIEAGDVMKLCNEEISRPTIDEPRQKIQSRAKFKKACQDKDRAAVIAVVRAPMDEESQTCKLTTVVLRHSFKQVNEDTWVSLPDPDRMCDNVAITQTLRRDAHSHGQWNYTEVVVARPSKKAPTLCRGISGTTEFTWEKAVTAYDLRCRYVAM